MIDDSASQIESVAPRADTFVGMLTGVAGLMKKDGKEFDHALEILSGLVEFIPWIRKLLLSHADAAEEAGDVALAASIRAKMKQRDALDEEVSNLEKRKAEAEAAAAADTDPAPPATARSSGT